MSASLTIWTNSALSATAKAELDAGLGNHKLVVEPTVGGNLSAGGASELLATADVAFGQPDPGQVTNLATLKWVQITSAGYTRYDTTSVRKGLGARGALFTNSSSVFDDPCAQHVLAFMLAQARQLPACLANQAGARSWPQGSYRGPCRVLAGDKVVILGFGAIARRLVELLAPFHVEVVATRRTVKGDEAVTVRPISELLELLPGANHVVNLLPSNPAADGLVDAEAFAAMKHGAIFYNVGRGTTVNQAALISALQSGHLAATYLDVTDPEPLPEDHPLWMAPNCYITPHIAGGLQDEDGHLVRHFLANLRRFEAGEPLADRVM